MKSMRIPFTIEGGKVADTRTPTQIVEQKIVDVLTTGQLERVGLPTYGAGVQQLLFEPVDELTTVDFKVDAVAAIQGNVSNVGVADIRISVSDETTAQVTAYYRTPMSTMRAVTFNVAIPGDLTEESPIV